MTESNTRSLPSPQELDEFYNIPDPWGYEENVDDALRTDMAVALLPARVFGRVLDIGCGNGFLTAKLPGHEIVGVDISEKALGWAKQRCRGPRYRFHRSGVLELNTEELGQFDLIVMTGVAYPQYIGAAFSLLQIKVDALLRPGGWLLHTHISDWFSGGFPYVLIDRHVYPYREYWHLLETYVNDSRVS